MNAFTSLLNVFLVVVESDDSSFFNFGGTNEEGNGFAIAALSSLGLLPAALLGIHGAAFPKGPFLSSAVPTGFFLSNVGAVKEEATDAVDLSAFVSSFGLLPVTFPEVHGAAFPKVAFLSIFVSLSTALSMDSFLSNFGGVKDEVNCAVEFAPFGLPVSLVAVTDVHGAFVLDFGGANEEVNGEAAGFFSSFGALLSADFGGDHGALFSDFGVEND